MILHVDIEVLRSVNEILEGANGRRAREGSEGDELNREESFFGGDIIDSS